MTAKEFVLANEPKMRIERQKQNGPFGKYYYLCRIKGNGMWFSEGETESKAWSDAAMQLAKRIVKSKHPNAGSMYGENQKGIDMYYIVEEYGSYANVISSHKNEIRAWILAAEKINNQLL